MAIRSVQEGSNRGSSTVMPGLDDYQPSWMDDGGGISGGAESDPYDDFDQSYLLHGQTVSAASWETQTTSRQNQNDDSPAPRGCLPDSPPSSGTSVWGAVDGVCQWIDTTTCA